MLWWAESVSDRLVLPSIEISSPFSGWSSNLRQTIHSPPVPAFDGGVCAFQCDYYNNFILRY